MDLTLLLQQDLDSELVKPRKGSLTLGPHQEAQSVFKDSIPSAFLPEDDRTPPAHYGLSSGFAWPLDGRVLCGAPLAQWCELRSHHASPCHKERFCPAGLVPGFVAGVQKQSSSYDRDPETNAFLGPRTCPSA